MCECALPRPVRRLCCHLTLPYGRLRGAGYRQVKGASLGERRAAQLLSRCYLCCLPTSRFPFQHDCFVFGQDVHEFLQATQQRSQKHQHPQDGGYTAASWGPRSDTLRCDTLRGEALACSVGTAHRLPQANRFCLQPTNRWAGCYLFVVPYWKLLPLGQNGIVAVTERSSCVRVDATSLWHRRRCSATRSTMRAAVEQVVRGADQPEAATGLSGSTAASGSQYGGQDGAFSIV